MHLSSDRPAGLATAVARHDPTSSLRLQANLTSRGQCNIGESANARRELPGALHSARLSPSVIVRVCIAAKVLFVGTQTARVEGHEGGRYANGVLRLDHRRIDPWGYPLVRDDE